MSQLEAFIRKLQFIRKSDCMQVMNSFLSLLGKIAGQGRIRAASSNTRNAT